MRIVIAAVGRGGSDPGQIVYDHYAHRIAFPLTLKEVAVKRQMSGPTLQRAEAELLLRAVPEGAVLIALDESGRLLSSPDFARRIGDWRDQSVRDLAFVIGGADGLDASVLAAAKLVLSLGPMVWPHFLVRGMLAEQLYRAQTILAGHPYHRG